MPTYGWNLVDSSGNPVPPSDWLQSSLWAVYPVANPPVTGKVPGAGNSAFIIAGTVNASIPFLGQFSKIYPTTVDVTTSVTIATLGLGGLSVTSIAPTFGTPTVLPTVDINGGSLDITANVLDTFSGTVTVGTPIGPQTLTGTPSGGGTIDLRSKGTVEIGGTAAQGITIDFKDGTGDLLKLDDVTGAATGAFAGKIIDFALGDTILLSNLHTTTHFVKSYSAGVLQLTDFGLGTLAASLNLPANGANTYSTSSFAVTSGAGGTSITMASTANPPSTPDLAAASDTGTSSTDNITKLATPTFTGTSDANATVTLLDGATVIGTGKASAAGAWSIVASKLSDGKHSIVANETDTLGHTSANSAALSVTIDSVAPATPIAPDLTAASDTGTSSTDNITSATTPTFTGTAEAGSTVTLLDGGTSVGTTTADATTGVWTIKASALADGVHNITVTAADVAGNVSAASAALAVTIDSKAPAAPTAPDLTAASDDGVSNTDNQTSIVTPTFTGTAEDGSTVTLLDGGKSVGTATADATTGVWSIKSSALGLGVHSITATATDLAGNVGAASTALAVTIVAGTTPTVPSTPDLAVASDTGTSSTDNITKLATPTFTGTSDANATVTLLDGATVIGTGKASAAGAWSIVASKLSDGKHSIVANETDTLGHTSANSAALSVTIDSVAPATPIAPDLTAASDTGTSSTDNITSATTPTFTGTAEAGSTVTLLDGGTSVGTATADATTGVWTIKASALADGVHNITVTAADVAGNVSAASAALAVTIDSKAPATPIAPDLTAASDTGTSSTDNITGATTPTFTGTAEAGSKVTLLDGGTSVGTDHRRRHHRRMDDQGECAGRRRSQHHRHRGRCRRQWQRSVRRVGGDDRQQGAGHPDSAGPDRRVRYRHVEHRQHHQRDHADLHRDGGSRLDRHPARRRHVGRYDHRRRHHRRVDDQGECAGRRRSQHRRDRGRCRRQCQRSVRRVGGDDRQQGARCAHRA